MAFRSLRVWLLRGFVCLCAALVGVVVLEGALRIFPQLLPGWYRSTFPAGGIEFVSPGILARTPIDAVPLPYRVHWQKEVDAPVPRDLQRMGLVDPGQNPDADRYGRVRIVHDRRGFANTTEMAQADVVLVGDSFVMAAGVRNPRGLQPRLEEALGRPVFNLGIPAIGPEHEAWLVREVALELKPRTVVWFVFGGNDIQDAERLQGLRRRGLKTHAERFVQFRPPVSRVFDLARKWVGRWRPARPARPARTPVAPFLFASREGPLPVWFHPMYLRNLALARADWEGRRGWRILRDSLSDAADLLARRHIELLVVYVPSKPEVYLPHVARNEHLAAEVARPGGMAPVSFWQAALAHRHALEQLLKELCERRRIALVSLVESLDQLARHGGLGYLSADSHWNEHGQAAAAKTLLPWLRPASRPPASLPSSERPAPHVTR